MRIFCIVSIITLILGCSQQKVVSSYNTPTAEVETYYTIQEESDSTTRVTYSISSHDLYSKSSKNSKSFIYFEIELYDESKNQLIHSYTSRTQVLYVSQNNTFIHGSLSLPYTFDKQSSLRIRMLNTNNSLLHSYTYYATAQNKPYTMLEYQTLNMWNQPYVYTDTLVFVNTTHNKNFIYYSYSSDESYKAVEIQKYKSPIINDTCILVFEKEGNYTLYSDSTYSNFIYTIPAVGRNFPKKNDACAMLISLNIINPSLPIDSLIQTQVGCKIELDKQWLYMSQNNEMNAKRAIQTFYSRIEKANKMYTITQQGMYSNRGLCLILLGEPTHIQYNTQSEIWYYGTDTTIQEKKFTFVTKTKGLQTDFALQDKSEKQVFFDIAQLNWKSGKAFTLR